MNLNWFIFETFEIINFSLTWSLPLLRNFLVDYFSSPFFIYLFIVYFWFFRKIKSSIPPLYNNSSLTFELLLNLKFLYWYFWLSAQILTKFFHFTLTFIRIVFRINFKFELSFFDQWFDICHFIEYIMILNILWYSYLFVLLSCWFCLVNFLLVKFTIYLLS